MIVAYLALGANLGDRGPSIARALDALAAAGVRVAARSPLYETDAVAPDPQPPYLNAAARIETDLPAQVLLDLCLDVERALGRVRPPGQPAAARIIDVDLLLYGDEILDEPPELVVPHPRLLARPFVRIPLADVALPGLVHPVTGAPLDRAAPDPSVRRAP
ncbi:MAG TPA: 2-amino-4-hydroxy-6-hydroxymethyldihydropteridine diphosphokinase [Polyangia bacterium]|jgi:2-amino-4-hydroxy-6-hydroxymethyldihydropteridine diphosphokinase|nr:2-amino-4-hydroxy-6-hydroxymethyldihydropteridine diphosphokinase [Polyangia bacterium]